MGTNFCDRSFVDSLKTPPVRVPTKIVPSLSSDIADISSFKMSCGALKHFNALVSGLYLKSPLSSVAIHKFF